jgi:radical SAM protein with 4Fe4S-binding SPASM domain
MFADRSFMCSDERVFDPPDLWNHSKHLEELRGWIDRAPDPCRSCDYLEICKGGCRAVSAFVTGDRFAPDPECPFVLNAK